MYAYMNIASSPLAELSPSVAELRLVWRRFWESRVTSQCMDCARGFVHDVTERVSSLLDAAGWSEPTTHMLFRFAVASVDSSLVQHVGRVSRRVMVTGDRSHLHASWCTCTACAVH